MSQQFLFLEITDLEINALFFRMKEIIYPAGIGSPLHLTMRGPYQDDIIPLESIQQWEMSLRQSPIVITNVGKFTNRDEYVVYYGIQHPGLRQLWWKPDFPIEKFGFNPHITIYKGFDAIFADLITAFLKKENIALLSDKFILTTHVSKQIDMFPQFESRETQFLNLVNRRVVSVTFLERLNRLVVNYKRARSGPMGKQISIHN